MQRIQDSGLAGGEVADIPTNDSTSLESTAERAQLDATGEFFSVGLPLHAVRVGYIERQADETLYSATASGRYAHVVAPSRSGKSSLLAATSVRLEAMGAKVAVVDLEQIGERESGADSGRWYYSVAYRLLRQLRIRFDLQTWWQDKSILSNRQRLLEFYSEVILDSIEGPIVVFVDQIQTVADIPDAEQFLASIRAAHNARTTDPAFQRLTFVLLGECDPVSLIEVAELSPFHVTEAVELRDFSRADIDVYGAELNLNGDRAREALDRIFFWTNGQPYLTQKLARAVSRAAPEAGMDEIVDRLVSQQLTGKAALHSEPHMSHVHRALVYDGKLRDGLLNLYGKLRKGLQIPADLGSPLQRRLMAVGLVIIDPEGNLKVRNRLYETVFTARWANDNLETRWPIPVAMVGFLLLFVLIPFWYTQWLPGPYVRSLTSTQTEPAAALQSFENLQSFPGHSHTAENLFRNYLHRRAATATSEQEIRALGEHAETLPNVGRLADEMIAEYWDRELNSALRYEKRDEALFASIRALQLATTERRQRAASLIGEDYPLLVHTLSPIAADKTVFDPQSRVLTTANGAEMSQWVHSAPDIQKREAWSVTALEVAPLVRRVAIDRSGVVRRVGLTLNVSHGRLDDLRIKIIAPSGRTVEILTEAESASNVDDLVFADAALRDFHGEQLEGTWSISIRDESLGVAGHLVGWNLKLNSQGAVEQFERGLNIPDPLELPTDNVWFDNSGRYAVARATQSDSARIWDLSVAEPLRAIAVAESETLVGLDDNAEHLITATQESINVWEISTGDRVAELPIGAASGSAVLTDDGLHLFVQRRGDIETILETWSIASRTRVASITVPGAPALVAVDADGLQIAVADFDRAVRVWRFSDGEQIAQLNLDAQPNSMSLSADGKLLAVTYPNVGYAVWRIEHSEQPLWSESGSGAWQVNFAPSGSIAVVGRPVEGYRILNADSGRAASPIFGMTESALPLSILAFSNDQRFLVTAGDDAPTRIWRHAETATLAVPESSIHSIWNPAAEQVTVAAPNGQFLAVSDADGHIHRMPVTTAAVSAESMSEDISYVGHQSAITHVAVDAGSRFIASAAKDGSIRVWHAATGEPLPYNIDQHEGPLLQMDFSKDASVLALLSTNGVALIETTSGKQLATFAMPARQSEMVFASDGRLFLGAADGALHVLQVSAERNWQLQQIWKSQSAIMKLAISPRDEYLILLDADNVARQFLLREGTLAEGQVKLPSPVQEIMFDNSGSRAYFRTHRWLHHVRASRSGLLWMDALLMPRALPGAKLVLHSALYDDQRPTRVFLPTAAHGYPELFSLDFRAAAKEALLGNQQSLYDEWHRRVSADHPVEF